MVQKIALIAEDYPTSNHPEFVFVQQLVEALVDKGVDLSVIAPQSLTRALFRHVLIMPRKKSYNTPLGNSYTVHRPFSISFGNGNKLLYKIAAAYNQYIVDKSLLSIQPDILYGHFWHVAYKLFKYSLKYKKPIFVACGEGDDALETFTQSLSKKRKEQFLDRIKGVICVSTENKRKCLDYGLCTEEQIIVLPNCVDTSIFHPQDSVGIRSKLGITQDDFVIVFTGKFIKRKGSQVVASALNRIGDNSIKAIFIGQPLHGDDYTPNYPGTIYQGKLDHDKIPDYLNCADVFVLPTLKEGCCNAIVEALACGIPVISSNRPFNDDILNNQNSIRINPESIDDVINAILRMKNDKKLYQTMKYNSIAESGNYSIKKRADNIIEFINSLL